MAEIRFKDLTKTLTYAQWLESFSPADSAANGTGKILGQTIVDNITGNAPNVSVTSTDGSLDITENSTPTSKTIDISVKRSFSDFVGTFSATLSNNVVVNSLVKTSGSMSISGTGVALPAGSYHVDRRLPHVPDRLCRCARHTS